MTQPIRVVSWRSDFIDELGLLLENRLGSDLHRAVVVFPHARPARYLRRWIAENPRLPKPCLLPQTFAFTEFASHLRRRVHPEPLRQAPVLDRVELLMDEVAALPGLLDKQTGRDQFLPWGMRLAEIMEELLRQGRPPRDLDLTEDEAPPFARSLLGNLSRLHRTYLDGMAERGWTSPGLDCRLLLDNLDAAAGILADEPVFVAGFTALSGAEEKLFKRLWHGGAEILWHTDPALGRGETPHHAASLHDAWRRRWGAGTEPLAETGEPGGPPSVRVVQGYDRHSQLYALQRELAAAPDLDETAVVLPDTALLVPLLHGLQEREVNISLGYPLQRSALGNLLENLMQAQERALEDGSIFHRDLLAVIRHPYLRMLRSGDEDEVGLRPVLRQWERSLAVEGKFRAPHDWAPDYDNLDLAHRTAELEVLRAKMVDRCLLGFSRARNMAGMAKALRGLVEMLLQHGGDLWHRFLIDAECLHRLADEVIPALAQCAMRNELMDQGTLFSVVREILRQQRVSFEPEPLGGLQVVGMLETRLLQFKRVYILEAVESRLPGAMGDDPLLPDSLRPLLGLPGAGERDDVAAATFHRLVQGADEAVLFYQRGDKPGVLDETSARSRYVEEALWEREKELGRVIHPGESREFQSVSLPMLPIQTETASIPVTESVREAIAARLLDKGLSPSVIDQYLRCPKAFFYRYVAGLRPPERVSEEGDRAALGTVVHAVLKDFLAPLKGREADLSQLSADELRHRYATALRAEDFFHHMPRDAQAALEMTGAERLRRFLENQGRTTIVELEQRLTLDVDLPEGFGPVRSIRLEGHLDRVDRRGDGVHVLDYKTGSPPKGKTGFWLDETLWSGLHDWTPDSPSDPMSGLAEAAGSVQLPLYMALWANTGETPVNAAWIELADKGEETPYFSSSFGHQERRKVAEKRAVDLTRLVLRHMLQARRLDPVVREACSYCDFKGPCGVDSAGPGRTS
ncbi:PD-(D/E)XK nuclease family protein [Desulfohalovibrio reitneri]|uniref:PD-(D/E)XK nuclease family protein n=1 Tax=Desulfohalovibrio reitneri TaxID=1307759 RepID=UPI0004A7179E|nr:PD-(D/E)XK nuclease family protein [Desulfohalovibrio reitneri]